MGTSLPQQIRSTICKDEKGPFGHLTLLNHLDRFLISEMHQWGIPVLRTTLGVVYFWFGSLKIMGVTPVADLIAQTYSFVPTNTFLLVLGWWEVAIGACLLSRHFLRIALALLWLQMAGTFFAFLLSPSLFFIGGNPLLLTVLGEFVIKNIVLTASGMVIGGYEIKRA